MYDCPLTLLEKSYLGESFTSTRLEFLQNIQCIDHVVINDKPKK